MSMVDSDFLLVCQPDDNMPTAHRTQRFFDKEGTWQTKRTTWNRSMHIHMSVNCLLLWTLGRYPGCFRWEDFLTSVHDSAVDTLKCWHFCI